MGWHFRSLIVALVPILAQSSNKGGSGVQAGAVLQIVLLITLMTAWLTQSSNSNPWRYARLNDLDRGCTWLFILMALTASFQNQEVGVFVTVVLVLFFAGILGFVCREIYLARSAATRPKADFFICHNQETTSIV